MASIFGMPTREKSDNSKIFDEMQGLFGKRVEFGVWEDGCRKNRKKLFRVNTKCKLVKFFIDLYGY